MVGASGQEVVGPSASSGALAFEEHGPPAATPVVCIHGLTANRSTWRAVAHRAAGDLRLVLVDLLGRGQSESHPTARYDLQSDAGRVANLVEALGLRRPFLAGHSYGAAVAVACAPRVRPRGLLLTNPVTPYLRRPHSLALLALPGVAGVVALWLSHFHVPLIRYTLVRRVFTGTRGVPADAVARYSEPWAEAGRARSLVSIVASWNPSELRAVDIRPRVPTIVVAGGRDRRIPESLARAWARELGAGFQVLADCGHASPEEDPEAVCAALWAVVEMANEGQGQGDLR